MNHRSVILPGEELLATEPALESRVLHEGMLGLAAVIGALIVGLVVVSVLRTRATFAAVARVIAPLQGAARRIAACALVPAVLLGGFLLARGIDPVAALIVSMCTWFGFLCVTLGLFKLEAVLWETESDQLARAALGHAPPQRLLLRIVTLAIGFAALASSLIAVRLVG